MQLSLLSSAEHLSIEMKRMATSTLSHFLVRLIDRRTLLTLPRLFDRGSYLRFIVERGLEHGNDACIAMYCCGRSSAYMITLTLTRDSRLIYDYLIRMGIYSYVQIYYTASCCACASSTSEYLPISDTDFASNAQQSNNNYLMDYVR